MADSWVVIPTYNEKDNIRKMIEALAALPLSYLQILIVDDSSPDGTGAIVKEMQNKLPQLHLLTRAKKEGLGKAYVHGYAYAIKHGAKKIAQMDADFSHDPDDVPRLLAGLEHYDVLIGSRYVNGISVVNWPLRRLIISMAGNLYARTITRMPFQDTTGGFRAWRSQTLQDINLPTVQADGYSFQIETLYRAWRQHKKISEVPIIFTERREGQSKMSSAIVREALWIVWKLRLFG